MNDNSNWHDEDEFWEALGGLDGAPYDQNARRLIVVAWK